MTTRKSEKPDEKSLEFKDQTAGKPGAVTGDDEKQAEEKGYIGQTPDDIKAAEGD